MKQVAFVLVFLSTFIGNAQIDKSKYDEVDDFREGFVKIKQNNKWGVANTRGEEVILPKYDNIHSFKEGIFKVHQNGKWGFINEKGKEIVSLKYDAVENFYEGFASVRQGELSSVRHWQSVFTRYIIAFQMVLKSYFRFLSLKLKVFL